MEPLLPSFLSRLGGKRKLCQFLVTLIPTDISTYVEPFAGAASVLFAKKRCKVEVLNDIEPDIIHLFADVRKTSQKQVDSMAFVPDRETTDQFVFQKKEPVSVD